MPLLRAELQRSVQNKIPDCEVILVDDGSTDGTLVELQAWAAADSSVILIRHATNLGQSSTIRTGMFAAQGEYVAIIDADLQDPPALIIEMLKAIRESKLDMVAARRASRAGESGSKKLTAWVYYRVVNLLLPFEVTRDAGEFRIVSQACVEKLRRHIGPIPVMRIFLDSSAKSRAVLPFARQARQLGRSHYSWSSMIVLAIMTLSYVSVARLAWLIAAGGVSAAVAIVAKDNLLFGTIFVFAALAAGPIGFLTLLGKFLARRLRWSQMMGIQLVKTNLFKAS